MHNFHHISTFSLLSLLTTIAWLLPQFDRLNNKQSDTILTNTGAPQGTVSSPFSITLYIADYRHSLSLVWFKDS